MRFARERSAGHPQLLKNFRIIRRRGHHRHVLPVLRRSANHGGAADVDVFDELFQSRILSVGYLCEVIKIHGDQVYGRDAMRRQRPHVLGIRAHGQDSASDRRVQRLHAAVQHFGELGDVRDFAQRRDTRF